MKPGFLARSGPRLGASSSIGRTLTQTGGIFRGQVTSRSVGFIQIGQEARLRIDAFPYQRFGMISGHIAQISKASYRPGELLAPIEVKETVYRVVVSFERSAVSAYGEDRALTPGMTLTADVVTDRRHFMDWVLDPLRAARARNGP